VLNAFSVTRSWTDLLGGGEQDVSASLSKVQPETIQLAFETNAPIRVLLADDHKIVRDGLNSLLAEQPGIQVVGQAEDGLSALEMARSLHPDVVVVDVSMPRTDGLEATRRLKAELLSVCVIGLPCTRKQIWPGQCVKQAQWLM